MRHALIQRTFDGGDFGGGTVELPFASRELVLTWNASTPMGTWLDVRFRVGDADGWSVWYEMGAWGRADGGPRRSEDARFGKMEVDILRAAVPFERVEYRIEPGGSGAEPPALRMVSICCSGEALQRQGAGAEGEDVKIGGDGGLDLAVPWLSQFRREVVWDEDMMKAGVCAPTSLTMALRYHGCRATVFEVAKMARDEAAGIYGNWAHMAAAAGEFGLRAWVERHSEWGGLLERLKEGAPPILSIAYGKGTFSDFPERASAGHLLVLRGWTDDGRLVCNDPGVEDEKSGRGVRFSPEELGRAFFGHGGVAVIVKA